MRRNRRFGILLLIFIMLCSTLLSGASSTGIASEKVKVIIAFHEQPGPSEEGLIRAFGGTVKYTYNIVPAIAATVPAAALEGLKRNPRIKLIEPDGEIHALADDYPWGITRVGAEAVHSTPGQLGEGVAVAIIDTGLDYNHPDLAGNYAGGYDFVNRDTNPMDDNGHGTHVAGTIAAEIDGAGVVGVAPKAKIFALKVLNRKGSGDFSNVIAALDWCLTYNKDDSHNLKIRITNNSYGGSTNPDMYGYTLEAAFNKAYMDGILHIAAAGNEGDTTGDEDTVGYPAKYGSVVAVAATDSSDTRAYFSSTGPMVEISAPGYGIYSTVLRGGYATYSGTSMASPHVAGVAALVMASDSTLSNTQVRARLNETALDLGTAGRDTWYGYGLVDAKKAVGTLTPPITNEAPVVQITSPENGANFDDDTTISFIGSVTDDKDTDLTSTLIWTSDLQGKLHEGSAFSTVLNPGTHEITASVVDSGGLTGSDVINVIVNENTAPGSTITVSSLEGTASTVNKNFWKATVTATVNPTLSGAVMTGTWSNGLSASGTTDSSGKVAISSGNLSTKSLDAVTFTVTNVALSGYTYVPGETYIEVTKP
ncbi:S8 family peptidase [Acidaminobacter hydrogenoformans]|uniref:Subtilisin n=1 Tax=Acidaminobacter hydrogenoformans DSM 2784 TaxID=1120920 RepID=A0A1G5RRV6_9FIRM|nr:S8 family peptidase [Acidaminobacter hydrogenoformans]SCZ76747.1 subtilisin [Acidaminobacter hydrogenoformans DSM 2784]